jgi:hypothetical protein
MNNDTDGKVRRKQAPRVPSAIQFPYTDMSDALQVADGLLKGGGVPMSRDQLAAAMALAPGGGGFANKISTARIFGVMESVSGKYQLTELGHEIVDPGRQQEAKVKAFLNVELFKRTYDEFRGRLLPPRPAGLDAAFMNFGVTEKLVRHARLAFEKSARVAGMYPNGNEDRLVIPLIGAQVAAAPSERPATFYGGGQPEALPDATSISPAQAQVGIHKSILGMLDELPPPKSEWSKAQQADWLDAVATLFQVIYKSEDQGAINVTYTAQGT